MTNKNNYGCITPRERLNLAIIAIGKENNKEDTYPYCIYLGKNWGTYDLEYKDYFTSYVIICTQFYTICADLFTRITACSYTLLLEAQRSKNKVILTRNAKMKNISDKQDALIAQLKAVYEGFYQFCDNVGLNGSDILKTINFGAIDPTSYLSMEHIEVNEEYTKEIIRLFMELWKH